MPSESGSAFTPPASNSERRLSNSSDGSSGSGYSKTIPSDTADFLATRPHTAAVIPGKPAANPLQFIKVGPADLGSRAREQLRKAELAKRTEPSRIETQEDWQSNLDNWKSSRRKRVEHIIERCVEVRRMENEPNQPRGKSKTFNEMLEERAGRRRRNPVALYTDDESHDLSDLGIGTSSTKSSLSEDCDTHSLASDGMDLDKNISDADNFDLGNRKLGSSANEYDTCTTTSPEPEEYTYERAIEGYKSRIISQTNSSIVKTVVDNNSNKETSPDKLSCDLNRIRTSVSNKIEEKVTSLQQDKGDAKNNNAKKDLPKVDILKRREQFERENSQESQINKPKLPEIANKKSIKDRMSSFEKFSDESIKRKSIDDLNKITNEVKPLRERLSSLGKVSSGSIEFDKTKRLSNGDLASATSVKERLSNFKTQKSEDDDKSSKTEIKEVTMSLKERLFFLDAAKNKDIPKVVSEIDKSETKAIEEENDAKPVQSLESQMQSFYRSLDSLDINGQSSPNSFERVQSLEDFDCDMQNNTVPSDIETEDSGIHTARDSCAPADDIADLTQVASPIGEPMIEVPEYDSPNEDSPLSPKTEEEPNHERPSIIDDIIIEEIEDQDATEDSESHYHQAVSQPEELSQTSEITELQLDKDEEDTLKSLENPDTSVSLNEPTSSSDDTVVFQGKMTIHLNLNEIRKGAGDNGCNDSTSNRNSMPMVLDALELAFKELDSEDSVAIEEILKMDDNQENLESSKSNNKTAENQSIQTNDAQKHNGEENKDHENNKSAHDKPANDKTDNVAPLYENIEVFYQNGGEVAFPLDLPPKALEPPKEKPPPPPVEDAGTDELLGNGNFKHTSSARRIKKEIRNKRTSFLGIEGQDDSYLDVDIKLAPTRPDITSFLQEEKKIEKLLYKRALSQDMDSKLRDSRDSGVDVDRGSSVENWYKGLTPDGSIQHSRQNSEPYNTTSSDIEDTKQRDIFATNLNSKLSNLHHDHDEQTTSLTDDTKIDSLDKKIQEQQALSADWTDGGDDSDNNAKEVLRFERELLQLEQEELKRQRENLMRDQTRIIQKSQQDISKISDKPITNHQNITTNHRHSMPNLFANESLQNSSECFPPMGEQFSKTNDGYVSDKPKDRQPFREDNLKRKPFVSEEHMQRHFGVEESRRVLYDNNGYVEKRQSHIARPPQPILPPRPRGESLEKEIIRNNRLSAPADYVNVDRTSVQYRQKQAQNTQNGQYHPMSRQALQQLSAAPTPKLISNNDWLQANNKKPNYKYNNQHWVIQEAEQRRLEDQRLKQRLPSQRHSYHQDMGPPPVHRMGNHSHSYQQLPQYTSPPPVPSLPQNKTHLPQAPVKVPHAQINVPHPPQNMPHPPQNMVHVQQNITHGQINVSHGQINGAHVQQNIPHGPHGQNNVSHGQINVPHGQINVPHPKMHTMGPHVPMNMPQSPPAVPPREEKILSVSGKRKCSHCGEELGRGAAMIIESLSLCYHVWCFSCSVCGCRLGDGRGGADVRVRRDKLHCTHCYTNPQGVNCSRV